jgi:hypothetical protein
MTRLVKTRFRRPSEGIRPLSAVPIQMVGIMSMLLIAVASTLASGGG